jgi:hypothetical protein
VYTVRKDPEDFQFARNVVSHEEHKNREYAKIVKRGKPGSSVSIVSDYGLDDRAIEVRSPAEAKGFFL